MLAAPVSRNVFLLNNSVILLPISSINLSVTVIKRTSMLTCKFCDDLKAASKTSFAYGRI